MPYLQSLIVDKGTTYSQHYCTVALCCPSRATLWTGRAAHNHNVTNVAPPHGGYPKVVEQGVNDDNLFLWMQDAGYNTYYVGKLWNFHSVDNYNSPFARGFNGSDFLLDPYTYQYYNAKITHNGDAPVSYEGQYSTDIISQKATDWLEEALEQEEPFFLTVSPIAPHSNWVIEPENNRSYLLEPRVADRHKHLFKDYRIPRDASFNKVIQGGASWIGELEQLNDTVIEYNDHYQRQRLRALQSVDEMLDELVTRLDQAGALDNTYIFYTTDNGYHISHHAMHPGKECGLDTDIHIPFVVRGPGIERGGQVDSVTSHTDVSSTILRIAGIEKQLDGAPIPLHSQSSGDIARHEHIAIEYWGPGVPEGFYGGRTDLDREAGQWQNYYLNNTYKGLRLVSQDYSLYYSVWCTNQTELYDLKSDPYQTYNVLADFASSYSIAGRPLDQIVPRLEALIMVLKTCKDQSCTQPWEVIHPDKTVKSLEAALNGRFDKFYAEQPRMWFKGCPLGYFSDWENQSPVISLGVGGNGGLTKQGFDWADHWQWFT